MAIIELFEDDPIVQRAKNIGSTLTEVGIIPGDKNGCKIYGRNKNDVLILLGFHSNIYGCRIKPQTDLIEIIPSPVKK